MANFTTAGSDVYQAGMIVKSHYGSHHTPGFSTSSTNWVATGCTATIDPIYTNSVVEISWHIGSVHINHTANRAGAFIIRNTTQDHYVHGSRTEESYVGTDSEDGYYYMGQSGSGRESLSTGASQTYALYFYAITGTFYGANGTYGNSSTEDHTVSMIIKEIKV